MKYIKFFSLLILLVSLFFGCKSANKEQVITYAIWDSNQEPGMRAIADEFEKENPGIKVKVEVTPWNEYWTKLEAGGQAKQLPDVFWMHIAYFLKYAQNDMLMEVGKKVEKDSDLDYSNYPEGLVKLYEYEGKNYAIPKDFDTIGLWYNKTLFDQAKAAYPDDSWDWNKFLEAAKKLTKPDDSIYGFAAQFSEQEGYHNFIYQNDGFVISKDGKKSGMNNPKTMEAIQFYTDLLLKYKVSPSLAQQADTTALQMFESGKIAMALFGSWMVSYMTKSDYVKANCDVAVLPKSVKRATIYNGLGNTISAFTKNPDASWKFLKFLGTKKANLIQAEYGSAIPAFNGTQEPWFESYKKTTNFNLKNYADQIQYGVIYPFSKTSSVWYEKERTNIRPAMSGETSVKEACDKQYKEMQELLDSE